MLKVQLLNTLTICDTIKRNESDVGDVVLEIIGKNSVQIPLFHIVFSIAKFFITL